MKKQLLLFALLAGLLGGCSDEVEAIETLSEEIQCTKWKLIMMTGQLALPPETGNDMEWQETYIFLNNDAFIKTRLRNGVTTEASGTYQIVNDDGEENLQLTFNDDKLVGNCDSTPVETLHLVSGKLVSTWQQCDGPGLTYKMVSFKCPAEHL